MMGLRNYLTISSLLLLTLLLSSCGYLRKPEKEIVVQTVEVQKVIPVQPRPKPVDMTDVKFYVVTEENYEEFKEKFMKTNNDFVFYVVSVHDYENLALNMSELFRYIKQQKEIVVYYEEAVKLNHRRRKMPKSEYFDGVKKVNDMMTFKIQNFVHGFLQSVQDLHIDQT